MLGLMERLAHIRAAKRSPRDRDTRIAGVPHIKRGREQERNGDGHRGESFDSGLISKIFSLVSLCVSVPSLAPLGRQAFRWSPHGVPPIRRHRSRLALFAVLSPVVTVGLRSGVSRCFSPPTVGAHSDDKCHRRYHQQQRGKPAHGQGGSRSFPP